MKASHLINLKLIVANAVFAAPILILLYFYIGSVDEAIIFGKQEKLGDRYQKPLMTLLYQIGEHQAYSQRLLYGDKSAEESVKTSEKTMDEALAELKSNHEQIGEALQFTPEGLKTRKREHATIDNFIKEWSELKTGLTGFKPEESNTKHAHLNDDLRMMISHMGDTSNLILDPDLDSYYLMDVTLVTLPQMADRLRDIVINLEKSLRRRHASDDEKAQAGVYAALLKQSDLDRLTGDLTTSLNEDPNFYGKSESLQTNIPKNSALLVPAIEQVIADLDKISKGNLPSAKDFVEHIAQARKLTDSFFMVSLAEMDNLLDTRVGTYQAKKTKTLIWSLAALLFAVGLSVITGFSIKRDVVKGVSSAVTQINNVAQGILESNRDMLTASQTLADTSERQASALQETVATLNEINAMVSKSAESATLSSAESQNTLAASEQGKSTLDQMITAIAAIKESHAQIMEKVDHSNKQVLDIVSVVRKIAEKTKVIDDIVFQTKLLSFNASVEAARAGEHGKGFAVVAEEVGNLAQMSGAAAKEISEMLAGSINTVNTIVENTKRSVQEQIEDGKIKVDSGLSVAHQSADEFTKVVKSIESVTSMMNDITVATKEQSVGVSEITKAMNQMDSVTHANAETSRKTSVLAHDLSKKAEELQSVVGELQKSLVA